MKYRIRPLFCRPWTLNGISPRLIESHYENNYGAALNRLNAVTHELETLDIRTTPAPVVSRLSREHATLLNSTLLRRRAQRDEDAHRTRLQRALRPRRRLGVVRLGRRAGTAARRRVVCSASGEQDDGSHRASALSIFRIKARRTSPVRRGS